MQKLWTRLATIFVEKYFEKNFGVVLDLFQLHHERIFWYLEKNGVLKFLEQVHHREQMIHVKAASKNFFALAYASIISRAF